MEIIQIVLTLGTHWYAMIFFIIREKAINMQWNWFVSFSEKRENKRKEKTKYGKSHTFWTNINTCINAVIEIPWNETERQRNCLVNVSKI